MAIWSIGGCEKDEKKNPNHWADMFDALVSDNPGKRTI